MTELTGLLALAAAGQSRFVLVAGEAGVGKSRLVAELRAAASVRGLTVVQGRCFEEDRTFPYAPVLDLLRHFCTGRATAELAHLFAPVAPELTQWLPELAALPAKTLHEAWKNPSALAACGYPAPMVDMAASRKAALAAWEALPAA